MKDLRQSLSLFSRTSAPSSSMMMSRVSSSWLVFSPRRTAAAEPWYARDTTAQLGVAITFGVCAPAPASPKGDGTVA
eukprot:scaffold870_cov268-Pinguiococcus_pyrenoidosus.AAC.10